MRNEMSEELQPGLPQESECKCNVGTHRSHVTPPVSSGLGLASPR